MTGLYPARMHLTDFIAGQNRPFAKLAIPDWKKQLDSSYITLPERLKQAGYRTGHFGKWHLASSQHRNDPDAPTMPLAQGFDVSIMKPKRTKGYFIERRGESEYLTDWLTDQACDFIESTSGEPFFLYFAYHTPHTPIQGRPDLVDYFREKVDPDRTHKNPTYAAMVKSLDLSVGKIISSLKKTSNLDDTLVIFISDNGGLTQRYGKHDGFTENLPLRRGKGSAYEGGVRVPMIASWPSQIAPGLTTDFPVMTIDLLPTLVDVAEDDADTSDQTSRDVDGKSLRRLFRQKDAKLKRNLYWHYPHYHAGGDGPYSAVRSDDFRLIYFYEDDRTELYNLAEDIGETRDLSAKLPGQADALLNDLKSWLQEVNAQLPVANPHFDPERQSKVSKRN